MAAGAAKRVPQALQNRASAGLSCPQEGQLMDPRHSTHGEQRAPRRHGHAVCENGAQLIGHSSRISKATCLTNLESSANRTASSMLGNRRKKRPPITSLV